MGSKTVRRFFNQLHLSFANRPHPPAPSPSKKRRSLRCPLKGGTRGVGEGFRVRATKVRCSLPTRTTRILVSIN
jgi:hypothetical protein